MPKFPSTPKPNITPDKVTTPVSTLKESAKVLSQIQDILKEHGGLESNIGIVHPYWDLLKHYRRLVSEGK